MFYLYEIQNKITGYVYIGYTSNLNWRWKEHHRDLKQQKHHNIHLQRAWDKYGEQAFEWNVLKSYEDKQSALLEEIYLIDTQQNLYNIAEGGLGGDWSKNLSEERKLEIRQKHRERNHHRFQDPVEKLKCNVFANLTEEERQSRLEVWSAAKIGNKNNRYKYDKPVLQIDQKTGEIVREWVDVSEAGRSGYERRYVLACCKGRKGYNSHKGYIWKWKE